MNWLYYLLEANLYLAAFYFMYKLLLQRSTFYASNRYFLILSIMFAFTIPFVQLNFLKPQLVLDVYESSLGVPKTVTVAQTTLHTLQDYLFYAYIAIAAFFSFKFIISISKIIGIYCNSNKRKLDHYTLVELTSEHTAFSFFNILFIHPNMAKNSVVLKHEMIHINQKHSWDIILLELLKICCWFNPMVYLMKKDLTLLHEYIADEQTTATTISKHEYAMFLIENSMAAHSSSLVNQLFNQSILKSRINMLNKEKTANWARLKYLLAVPLSLALLCVSTLTFSKSYGYLKITPQQEVPKKKAKDPKVKQKALPAKSKANESTPPPKKSNIAPPTIEAPPAGKKLKKFPPPVEKADIKTETTNLKESKAQEIEITALPSQKEIVVQGYKAPANKQAIQKVKGINLEEKSEADKEIVVRGYKISEKAKPAQKAEGIEIVPQKKRND